MTWAIPEILATPERHPTLRSLQSPRRVVAARQGMIAMVRRHEIQVKRQAGRKPGEIAEQVGVSQKAFGASSLSQPSRRSTTRPSASNVASDGRRRLSRFASSSRSSWSFSPTSWLLRRAKSEGYVGGKSALYEVVRELRPNVPPPVVRFEGLPGEFSQHRARACTRRSLCGVGRRPVALRVRSPEDDCYVVDEGHDRAEPYVRCCRRRPRRSGRTLCAASSAAKGLGREPRT